MQTKVEQAVVQMVPIGREYWTTLNEHPANDGNTRIENRYAQCEKWKGQSDERGLLRMANQTVVYSVDENSPAQKAGIGPKDIILKINEKDAGEYDMWDLRQVLMSEDKRNITMTIKQGENVKDVTFQLEKKIWYIFITPNLLSLDGFIGLYLSKKTKLGFKYL